ncbi:secreted RxLR effector protein 161-like [Apium graveolens]|uniref:secreted RxLR effector protein 161-like n=1 Tax=Apium graveolens TaxID=4045 RepID=UPI003D7A46AA
METPTVKHQHAVKHIPRYIKGKINHGLEYVKEENGKILYGFTDSELAGDVVDRTSTGGMCFYLNKNLISRASQKQRVITLSSYEAEYMTVTIATCQSIWLHGLLREISGHQIGLVVLYVDNSCSSVATTSMATVALSNCSNTSVVTRASVATEFP